MLMLLLLAQVTLIQEARSFGFDLSAPVVEATPLFGPVREREWSPDWKPQFIHPAEPAQREGAVFTTATKAGVRLWVMTEYDPQVGRVAYLVTDPDVVTEIEISVVSTGERASRATVTYRRSALTERGNAQVRALTPQWAAQEAHHWHAAIAAALTRGGGHD
jgi:hypothetical protein